MQLPPIAACVEPCDWSDCANKQRFSEASFLMCVDMSMILITKMNVDFSVFNALYSIGEISY